MNNKQYHIAERNNYFLGKLMTVRDFLSEQTYFNSKRRLGNRMLGGPGIVAGMDIFLIDDKTFNLDTGLAFDYLGREIVVSQPCVRKLNVIKGFEENKEKGTVYLCIRYKEKLEETTFSVAGSGQIGAEDKQHNRIKEGYELFITSDALEESELKIDGLAHHKIKVYNDNGIKIHMAFPKYANPGKTVKIKLYFEKEKIEEPINFSFKISGELFKGTHGNGTIISFKESEVSTYKTFEKEYFLTCTAQDSSSAEFIIDRSSFNLTAGKYRYEIDKSITVPVSVRAEDIAELVVGDYYSRHFDRIIENVESKSIYLAKFYLVTDKLNYFIEGFKKHPFKQYVYSNDLLRLMQKINYDVLKSYSSDTEHNSAIETENIDKKNVETFKEKTFVEKDNIITGVEKINLGFNAKPGKSYYSYELVHGLGAGPVGIVAAVVDNINDDLGGRPVLVFGDKSIFDEDKMKTSAPNSQIAAVLNPEKGTFRLGVRLKSKTSAQTVDIRWWAFRPIQSTEEKENLIIDDSVKILISPNTARVKPLGQVRFEVSITSSNDQRIKWEMAEKNTGNVDSNGLYTAPATEGVYEIKANSILIPELNASAYVVVSSAED
ncbi:MAG: hypothetical protein LBK29_03910 [Oscillospiraceae bacterium]|jgi:hypothetical protein|nr:hypothetical protein [Oscillospiraceae bacterium]